MAEPTKDAKMKHDGGRTEAQWNRSLAMMQKMVLVAEGNTQWRGIFQRHLVASGFTVTTAIDGLTCLAGLETHWPDVLVVDLDMLWGGAEGILSWVREQPGRRPLPIFIVTGKVAPETMSSQTGVHASHCLQKPFPLKLLRELCAGRLPRGKARIATAHAFAHMSRVRHLEPLGRGRFGLLSRAESQLTNRN
jgi:DNA-binding response OmpR family regulator